MRTAILVTGLVLVGCEVAGLDALLERTARSGYRFFSVGGQPIQRPFGRFVFAIDADGVLVEYVEPAVVPGEMPRLNVD